MYLSAAESRTLGRLFGLLSEDMAQRDVRERVGHDLLDLLQADYFASFVWDDAARSFGDCVSINMNGATLATYDTYYQYCDPITFALQARRVPTLVTQVMPQRDLMKTEFFNDFLARDGLHWGVNSYSVADGRHLGDLRVWRGRRRDNFDAHTLALLQLVEPAFNGALQRARSPQPGRGAVRAAGPGQPALSARERQVAQMLCDGLTDKEIAVRLQVGLTTVRTYLQRIADKWGVRRRGGIAALVSRLPRD